MNATSKVKHNVMAFGRAHGRVSFVNGIDLNCLVDSRALDGEMNLPPSQYTQKSDRNFCGSPQGTLRK